VKHDPVRLLGIRVQGVERAITVSIGVADLIQHGGDASGLLRQADRALYTAKATGRNRVVIAGANDSHTENGEVAVGVLARRRSRADAAQTRATVMRHRAWAASAARSAASLVRTMGSGHVSA
jgi:predicted signal transduction protein with EAL and GGDEF domain